MFKIDHGHADDAGRMTLLQKPVAGWNVTSGNVRWFGSEGDAGRLGWAAGGGGVTPVSCETETR